MPTLSQRLGSFPGESRAESFPQRRQDFPLSPPINRGGFDGLRKEKIGSKIRKKPTSLSLYTLSPLCSQQLQATLPLTRLPLSPPLITLHQKLLFFPPWRQQQHHYFHFLPSLISAAATPIPPQTPPPASRRLPRPPPTSRQASDNSFFSSVRLPPVLLRDLQLWSCMQNVNLLFTFCN